MDIEDTIHNRTILRITRDLVERFERATDIRHDGSFFNAVWAAVDRQITRAECTHPTIRPGESGYCQSCGRAILAKEATGGGLKAR